MTMQNKISKTKTTKGRQKIPIKRLIDENCRQVTFSKRREGLYNKASELCILTGARIAIITFSPNVRKPFCFSHPEMDAILEAYNYNLGSGMQRHDGDDELEKVFREQEARIEQMCWEPRQQSEAARLQLEAALMMNKDDEAAGSSSSGGGAFWWDEMCVHRVDDVEELEEFTKALTDVKNNLRKRCNQLMMMMGISAPTTTTTTGDEYYSTTDHHTNYTCNNITHHNAGGGACSSGGGDGGLASDHHHHDINDGSANHEFDHRLLGFGGDADYLHNWNFG